jgi:hypothetical protein
MNWVFISQKTAFFIVTAVRTSNLTFHICSLEVVDSVSSPDTDCPD